ncbi:HEAT repeat domain-containing protein [Teredinibacter franksiae]|uniref:HEAT repeat domain-containing protein n=1 Tax=Teredinibacter franksiae TaxID=2761453 RepID=UPI00162A730D|nr:HEAT repeat domain-containing protein [Teredinibacter franksiae]
MQKILFLCVGVVIGTLASYFYFATSIEGSTPTLGNLNSGNQANATASAPLGNDSACAPATSSMMAQIKPESLRSDNASPLANKAEVEHLMKAFQLGSENLYSSNEFKDLAYLVRHNKSVVEKIKNQILESESYDERMSLIAVLANDESEETVDFATSLIQSIDSETQNFGFELLFSMGDDRVNTPALNATLLDAASYETNPQSLGNIINLLTAGKLDESTKAKANESFQRLVSRGENSTVTARAIDGISRLGNQDAIYLAVTDHLIDPDPDVKTAAINAISYLDKNKVNQEMIETLKHLANNSEEPSIVREYATMILKDL